MLSFICCDSTWSFWMEVNLSRLFIVWFYMYCHWRSSYQARAWISNVMSGGVFVDLLTSPDCTCNPYHMHVIHISTHQPKQRNYCSWISFIVHIKHWLQKVKGILKSILYIIICIKVLKTLISYTDINSLPSHGYMHT